MDGRHSRLSIMLKQAYETELGKISPQSYTSLFIQFLDREINEENKKLSLELMRYFIIAQADMEPFPTILL